MINYHFVPPGSLRATIQETSPGGVRRFRLWVAGWDLDTLEPVFINPVDGSVMELEEYAECDEGDLAVISVSVPGSTR